MSYKIEKELCHKRLDVLTKLVCAAISKQGLELDRQTDIRQMRKNELIEECYKYMISIEQSVLLENFLEEAQHEPS